MSATFPGRRARRQAERAITNSRSRLYQSRSEDGSRSINDRLRTRRRAQSDGSGPRGREEARDSGHNVQQVRGMLKAARSAFEAGDYTTAARFADQVLDTCGDQSVRAAGGPPRAVVLERISEALRATKKRKRRGFNVEQSQQLLRQARVAFESGDYRTAMDLADQALQLCSPDAR